MQARLTRAAGWVDFRAPGPPVPNPPPNRQPLRLHAGPSRLPGQMRQGVRRRRPFALHQPTDLPPETTRTTSSTCWFGTTATSGRQGVHATLPAGLGLLDERL